MNSESINEYLHTLICDYVDGTLSDENEHLIEVLAQHNEEAKILIDSGLEVKQYISNLFPIQD